ncbi:MAG: ABC transporter ATP-binding protein [Lachnospiraceae bacterium]|nr:ABC transporter ATP-binding protein [Lachnospiraceae bacterium]
MKILKQLIKLHKFLFMIAILFTFLSIISNLCWNKFLAKTLDIFGDAAFFNFENSSHMISTLFITGIVVILLHTISEYLSSYTCEIFAHEMRMGYVRYYLQSDFQILSKLNVGEEQSAMQNELKDVSDYLNQNLFSLMKQFGTFAVTVVFLFCQNIKLAILSIFPVIPLIIYCSFSSKVIKNYTQQCLNSKKKINGLADMILELFPIIQVYDSYRLIKSTMWENLLEWENANVRKERIYARLMSLSGVLSFVPLLLLLGFGGAMVINGEISTGTFYIFINLSGNVSGFLQNMPGIYANFRRFGASVDKLEEKLVLRKV